MPDLALERARITQAAPHLLARIELIVDATPLFYATSPALEGGALPGGSRLIPLGAVVQLWERGAWRAPCRACGALGFVLSYAGSCFSGSHSWTAGCATPGCAGAFEKQDRSLADLHLPLQELWGRAEPSRAWRRRIERGEAEAVGGAACARLRAPSVLPWP